MQRFTYKVIVDVPDDALRPNDDVAASWSLDEELDDEGNSSGKFSPETLANMVMSERLGCDDDYGFDYKVDWESLF